MNEFEHRILGPNHNRLLEVGGRYRTDGSLVRGTIELAVANKLVASGGWTVYSGPAKAVDGWVVPDSDPTLTRRNTIHH